jgi:predicted MFS family arabinose efflux permease
MSRPLRDGAKTAKEAAIPTPSAASAARPVRLPSVSPRDSIGYVWYVTGLLFVLNIFNYMDRMALSMLVPSIKAELQLSDAQLGLLTGFAFALFYAVCAIPIARWADRGVRTTIIVSAVAIWSVMTALSGAAQNFWHLFIARVGVGVGEAGGAPPAQSLLCDYVPVKRRPLVLAINTFGLGAGMMIGMGLSGWLSEWIGWRWTFVVLGAPGIALAALAWLTLREPPRGRFDTVMSGADTILPFGETLGVLWRCRTYRLLMIYVACAGFFTYGLLQWWPSFLVRMHDLDLTSVGIYLGLAAGAGAGVGVLSGGVAATRAAERNARSPLMIGAAAVMLAAPAAIGSLLLQSVSGAIFFLFLAVLLISVASAPVVATIYSVVTSRMRATAGAISIFFQSVLGFGLGPFCVGSLSDSLAPSLGAQSLRYALFAPICLIPLMVVVLYAATKRLPNDLKATETHV